jgi:hypothetical protein
MAPSNGATFRSPHKRRPTGEHAATRICLNCDKPFDSEGPWNRRCRDCDHRIDEQRLIPVRAEHGVKIRMEEALRATHGEGEL